MAKKKIDNTVGSSPAAQYEPMPLMALNPSDSLQMIDPVDRLFKLYVARVAKAETVNTMRRDLKAIFKDAFSEAQIAFDVFRENTGVRSLINGVIQKEMK